MISTPKLEWVSRSTNGFELEATAGPPEMLVVSQIYYPGWKAYVDGRAVPVMRANYALSAIYLPPGPHHVRFSFEPWTFKAGLGLSMLAIAALGLMVFRGTDQSNPNHI